MAELHVIGQISSAISFKQSRLLCKWSFHAGNGWKVLNGCEEGQTQESCDLYTNEPVWDHPIDIHYTTQTLQNSPKLLLQIYCRDTHERILFTSYGVCNIPLSPGLHSIECHTWKPIGNWKDRLRDKFLGITLQLKSPNVLVNSLDRFELLTESMGTVKMEIHILTRNFEKYGCHIMIKMNGKTFALMLFCIMCNEIMHAKKIEEIFTCINETECNDLSEKDDIEESLTTTIESIYSSTTVSSNNSTDSTENIKIQILPTMQTPNKLNSRIEIRNHSVHKVQSDVCECNLVVSSCDINCCCDKDCTDFHLMVFSHCENHQADLYDKRYCYNRNFIERNNTPYILEQLASNLFCILYDNLPPTYSVTNDLDIKTEKDLREAMNPNRLKWNWENQLQVAEYNTSSPYQDGDIIWIIQNIYIQPFGIYYHTDNIIIIIINPLCMIYFRTVTISVKYLRKWQNQCLQTELINTNKFLFPTAFNNFTVIASPHLLNETYIEMSDQICPKNICLTLTNYYCKHSWQECNNTIMPGSCVNGTCYNVVTGVKYLIVHNGSAGINSVNVYFSIGNVSQSFYQQFETIYEWAELDKEKSFSLSGNPGYILGKPLIIGTLNNTNNVKTVIFNKTDSYLTLPIATRGGECSGINRYTVAFGEDSKIRCSVPLYTNNFNTSSCIELQNRTMYFLLKDSMFNITETDHYSIYVSKTGNFTNNNTADWAQILLDRVPQNIVTGQLINDRLHCSGLITSVHLHILYSALAKPETLTNYNILGIGIYFSNESDISWSKCLTENCTNVLKVDIVSYVTFHDISKPSRYYFVGSPNLDFTLPYDFFYPFLSSSMCIKSNVFFIRSIVFTVVLYSSFS
ncbi:PREDICTED: tectonic-3-like [Dufourea novaeangliae]|uniref:tectonic-3-like n=1 Tax=Dufourea novaeangliae TaxID=178035 RepID=UPI0007671577|nr:PREDICTED: tectonic-3-like [Dufourea novaeangliae]